MKKKYIPTEIRVFTIKPQHILAGSGVGFGDGKINDSNNIGAKEGYLEEWE